MGCRTRGSRGPATSAWTPCGPGGAGSPSSGCKGLTDRPRSGRPPVHGPVVRAEVVALACALPAEHDVPLSRWSCPEIARELGIRCQVSASASSVRRWLAADALKPWQHRSWISIRDPDFAVKAARVLDLYAGIWDGQPLGPGDVVICADEKTSIQARCRCHPTLAPGQARAMRVEHDYRRGGALAYLAAWDVHRGQVIGRCEDTTGIEPFSRLVTQVMTARALRPRGPGVLDRGQRLLAPRSSLDRPDAPRLAERPPDPPTRARLLAGPGRDLLLRRPTQGRSPQRLHRPRSDPRTAGRVRGPLQRRRQTLQLEVHPTRARRTSSTASTPTTTQPIPSGKRPDDPGRTYGPDR